MDMLKVLEEKVVSLVAMIKDLKAKNVSLEAKASEHLERADDLVAKNKDLKSENAKLAEENAQLVAKLDGLKGSVYKGTQEIETLNEEKALAKVAVDDLIKSIDDLVEIEKQ